MKQRKNETREAYLMRKREYDAKYRANPEVRERRRKWHEEYNKTEYRKTYLRDWKLQNRYGITLEQYEALAKAQQHLCLVCGVQPPDGSLVTDHCHNQGHVRGLLCGNCNTGLGMFKDSTETLRNAITYLTPDTFECGAGI